MVFFFLIPVVPAILGNFLVPIMIGAKDLAFPRINLLSWYLYIIAGIMVIHVLLTGGVDTGWTFYTPYSTAFASPKVVETGLAVFINGFSSIFTGLNPLINTANPVSTTFGVGGIYQRIFVHFYWTEFYRHHSPHARAGHDLVAAAAVYLGELRHQPDHGFGYASDRYHSSAAGARTRFSPGHL